MMSTHCKDLYHPYYVLPSALSSPFSEDNNTLALSITHYQYS